MKLPAAAALVAVLANAADAAVYCARWDEPASQGVFVVETRPGRPAVYGFAGSLDASSAGDLTACPAALDYHLHTKWTATATSGHGTGCAPSVASGHYDPTLACGPASEWHGSAACTGRGYGCNRTAFAENAYACEVGDLSGKFGGAAYAGGAIRSDPTHLVDRLPPMDRDFEAGSAKATTWSSIVFHCAASRLFCARFNVVADWAACAQGPHSVPAPPPESSTPAKPPREQSDLLLPVSLIAIVSCLAAIVLGFLYLRLRTLREMAAERQASTQFTRIA